MPSRAWLGRPVDLASLAAFRIAFGSILFWEITRYLSKGWVHEFFVAPAFAFKYPGFAWVEAWPEPGMTIHFALLGALALGLAFGVCARLCAAGFGVGLLYVFLLDQSRYLNHFYLIILLSLLLSSTDCGRAFSLGNALRKRPPRSTVPRWQLDILRLQLAIVYLYAGLAKLNPDWLAGEPMRTWLARRTHFPIVGPFFAEDAAAWLFSYGGLAFDLLVIPALLWSRTRLAAVVASVAFHATNAWLFSIGIFPWMMIAATTLYLQPDWPRRLLACADRPGAKASPGATEDPGRPVSRTLAAALACYVAVQLLVPLRHHLLPGWVQWTEEGHHFSWRMMLREKSADGVFVVATGSAEPIGVVDPGDQLPAWQVRPMLFNPELMRQFAHHVAERIEEREGREVIVTSRVTASLNGRPRQYLVDPDVDLSAQPFTFGHGSWIRPLVE